MAKIGFRTEPEFEPKQVVLDHYRTYGSTVLYRTEIRIGKDTWTPSIYVPKSWFGKCERFPSSIAVAIAVPDGVRWDRE
jgi:hypothetical protein